MAMSAGNIIQITMRTTFASQQALNVFHYAIITPQSEFNPETVCDAFVTDELAVLMPQLSSQVVLTGVEYKDLTNGLDIYEKAYSVNGGQSGDALPPFAAYAFRFNRSTALTRHGQKRFWGIPESHQANGTAISSQIPYLTEIADTFNGDLQETAQSSRNFVANPVIVGRTLNAQNVYELDLTKINPVASVAYVRISTQNTRKIGRGT